MKFFFPDSQDQVDPSFDFVTEERAPLRARQRNDRYAHEVLTDHVIDGILVSKAVVDGLPYSPGKYTLAQRHRLYRSGAREFFRLDAVPGPRIQTMGDCGAFNYIKDEMPPFTPDQVIDFYEECGFDLGLSVDHIILGYDAEQNSEHIKLQEWMTRQRLTLELAGQFMSRCHKRNVRFEPLGVAQGWSPASYAAAVDNLQQLGYRRIAVGGVVPLKTHEIVACLRQIDMIRFPETRLHLLGITHCASIPIFAELGVTSFDSTSPFRQAFKDDKENYHTLDRTFRAIHVPQVDGNPKLKKNISAGRVNQQEATRLEQECLRLLREYNNNEAPVKAIVETLEAYQKLLDIRGGADASTCQELLEEAPWKRCQCGICSAAGIEIVIFRGSERNKRRGFHNIYTFRQRLDRELITGSSL
jgi:hypothetical protein